MPLVHGVRLHIAACAAPDRAAHYFTVPLVPADIASMVQHEGADMRFFTLEEILALPRVSPWDLGVILMHARGPDLFAL